MSKRAEYTPNFPENTGTVEDHQNRAIKKESLRKRVMFECNSQMGEWEAVIGKDGALELALQGPAIVVFVR